MRIFVTGGSPSEIKKMGEGLKQFNPQHSIRCHEKDLRARVVIAELKQADLIIFVGVDADRKPFNEAYITVGELAYQIGICENTGLNYILL